MKKSVHILTHPLKEGGIFQPIICFVFNSCHINQRNNEQSYVCTRVFTIRNIIGTRKNGFFPVYEAITKPVESQQDKGIYLYMILNV